jgi:serine protease AprX
MAASNGTGNGYVSLSGTSMASPFAAGTAALMLSVDPFLSPDDVRRILSATAHEWGPGGADPDYGAGRIDVLRAVQQTALERALREGWSHAELARFDVAPPQTTVHASGTLTAQAREASFTIAEAGQPLAVTVIHNGSRPTVPNPAMGGALTYLRAIVVQVIDPDDQVVGTLSQSPSVRQQTFTFPANMAGEYTISVRGLAGEERLFYDVAGGLQRTETGSLIPDASSYATLLGTDADGPGEDAPAGGFGWAAAALAALAAALRNRR